MHSQKYNFTWELNLMKAGPHVLHFNELRESPHSYVNFPLCNKLIPHLGTRRVFRNHFSAQADK